MWNLVYQTRRCMHRVRGLEGRQGMHCRLLQHVDEEKQCQVGVLDLFRILVEPILIPDVAFRTLGVPAILWEVSDVARVVRPMSSLASFKAVDMAST
jgi:hypothetical protein